MRFPVGILYCHAEQVQEPRAIPHGGSHGGRHRSLLQHEPLLQSYRYYTDKERNPLGAWTSMEAEAFWVLFKEYEDAGGNGYIHTVVQPAMNLLKVIDIEDAASVLRLTDSRK